MFYLIYETTNIMNGKKYIGKHMTDNIYDNYLGSGMVLKKAIAKYGKENFEKRILFIYDNETDMNNKEIELITIDILLNDQYYNVALGGSGGVIVLKQDHPLYDSTKRKISEAQRQRIHDMSKITTENHKQKKVGMYGKSQSDYQKKTVSDLMRGVPKKKESINKQIESLMKTLNDPNYVHPNKGRKYDEEHSKKMSVSIKNRIPKTCTHCGKTMNAGNYARYHGDKCKSSRLP
jgi:Putative endonuclease segE, GIY-YIG domain